ncbi:MAG: lactonase family protein [Bryobacterales bacterium]|nr:lactonase family protein [Bryobacterales bacterium]
MKYSRRVWWLLLVLLQGGRLSAAEYLVYIGTYTRGESKGIYAWRFDATSGRLTELGLAAEATNPSFLAVHPSARYLYAVSEIAEFSGQKSGAVNAYAIDRKTGRLALLNQVSSGGLGPCYVSVDATGRCVLVANYGGGSVAAFPVGTDGRLRDASALRQHTGASVHPRRQRQPHPHSIQPSPDNRFALAADLGVDKLFVYRFHALKGSLEPHDPPAMDLAPGSGPRHFAFHPSGRFVYVINELASTVTAFRWEATSGRLRELHTVSTLPEGFAGENTTAEIRVHPNGKFLYGSNRGHDSIAVFAVDPKTGLLSARGHVPTGGKTPRNFNLDPSGRYLWAANQNSNNVTVFRVDPATGGLTPTGQRLNVPSPVCVRFVRLR